MKKQLLIVALALGFVATTECHKQKNKNKNTYQLTPLSSVTVKANKPPVVPAGVTVTKIGKKRYRLTNTNAAGTPPVPVSGKRK